MGKIQQQRLTELESVVVNGLSSFMDVGIALAEIQESKLYKSTHRSFEAYCEERFGFSRSYGYRLIAAKKQAELSPNGDTIENEHQARKQRQTRGGYAGSEPIATPTRPDSAGANVNPAPKSPKVVQAFTTCPQCGFSEKTEKPKRAKSCPHSNTVFKVGRRFCLDCGEFV